MAELIIAVRKLLAGCQRSSDGRIGRFDVPSWTLLEELDAALKQAEAAHASGVQGTDEARRDRLIANGYETDSRCTWLAIGRCAECERIHDGQPKDGGS